MIILWLGSKNDHSKLSLAAAVQIQVLVQRMKIQILLLLLLFLTTTLVQTEKVIQIDSENVEANVFRQIVAQKHLKLIGQHNSNPESTYTMTAYPQFISLTDQEFRSIYLSKVPVPVKDILKTTGSQAKLNDLSALKKTINLNAPLSTVYSNDFSTYSPTVYNQQLCGNGYAFSSVECVNLRNRVTGRSTPVLSMEQLTDCSNISGIGSPNQGCVGGYITSSMYYMLFFGLAPLSSYPLNSLTYSTGVAQPCKTLNSAIPRFKLPGFYILTDPSCNTQLNYIYNNYPVSTYMYFPPALQFYQTGVVIGCPASNYVNHAMLIVGFRLDGSLQGSYFKMKNSFGVSWGESGYIRMTMLYNQCLICTASVSAP